MKLLGKTMMSVHKSEGNDEVIAITGIFVATDQLREILGDRFNLAILEIDIKDIAIMPKPIEPDRECPDFLSRVDQFDWQKVLLNGIRLTGQELGVDL